MVNILWDPLNYILIRSGVSLKWTFHFRENVMGLAVFHSSVVLLYVLALNSQAFLGPCQALFVCYHRCPALGPMTRACNFHASQFCFCWCTNGSFFFPYFSRSNLTVFFWYFLLCYLFCSLFGSAANLGLISAHLTDPRCRREMKKRNLIFKLPCHRLEGERAKFCFHTLRVVAPSGNWGCFLSVFPPFSLASQKEKRTQQGQS